MKIKLSSPSDLGKRLKDAISGLAIDIEDELDEKLSLASKAAYDKAVELAKERLHRTADQYIRGLTLEQVAPNVFAVRLDPSVLHLEDGYDRFDMKPGLLHLTKSFKDLPKTMKTGKDGKVGGIRMSKDGYRYRAIAFDKNPSAKTKTGGSLAADLSSALKRAGLNKTTLDRSGMPVIGKVATIGQFNKQGPNGSEQGYKLTGHNGADIGTPDSQFGGQNAREIRKTKKWTGMDPRNAGVTKYQYEDDKGNVKSAYLTFRMVSENPKYASKWWHPGFKGVHILEDVQRWTEDVFAKMVDEIFSKAA